MTTARRGRRRPRTAWELRELIHPQLPERRRLAKLPPEQPFYPALVEAAWRLRYSTAGMLQRLYPQWLPSERTAQRHLAHLVDRGYLATTTIRNTARNFPLVYFAGGRGLRLVQKAYAAHGVDWQATVTEQRRARGQALESVVHELLTSEVQLAIRQTIEQRKDLRLLWEERRFFRPERKLAIGDTGRVQHVIPDAGFLTARVDAGGKWLLPLTLLETDNGTESIFKIRSKYNAYTRWAESSATDYLQRLYGQFGVRRKRPQFRLLVVAHNKYDPAGDERRLLDLFAQALDLPPSMRQRMWFAAASDLAMHQLDDPPLAAMVWYKAADADDWQPAYRSAMAAVNGKSAVTRYARQRAFVAERLPSLPRHPLFLLPRRS